MPLNRTEVLVFLLLATSAVIFYLYVLFFRETMLPQCPEECECYVGKVFVNCSNFSLSNLPLNFPTELRVLKLSGKCIKSLEMDSFISRGLTELEQVTAFNCGLETIELGAFNGLANLIYLSINFNTISKIMPRTFEQMIRLENLDLSDNRIEHLDVDVFKGLINVNYINLERNKLQYLNPDLFVGLPNLEQLLLSHNPDLHIPTDCHFINSHSLSRLYISKCSISSVSVETFGNVSALKLLDLSYNNLNSVDINVFKVLPKLSTLYLHGNRLKCDCQLQEVWRWCQDHTIETAYGKTAPECDTPSEVQGIWWGVFEKGQCLQGNIYHYRDYENTRYIYSPSKKTDTKLVSSIYTVYVFVPVYAVLLIFGTTSNAILITIIIRNKAMRTVPNMYILNLAISDMIYLTLNLAVVFAFIIFGTDKVTTNFFTFCGHLSAGLSAYSVALLSVQRYTVIVTPIQVRVSSQQRWRATVATICVVWIVAAFFAFPSISIIEMDFHGARMVAFTYTKIVLPFELLVHCVLPLCVIVFSYIKTALHLVKSAHPISEGRQNPQLKRRKNTAKIVLGLTVVFLISCVFKYVWLTYYFFNILTVLSGDFSLNIRYTFQKIYYTSSVLICLVLLNSCLNPVALCCTSLAFRRQFKRYLTCCFKTNSPLTNLELTRRN